jgi:hypothetical protein
MQKASFFPTVDGANIHAQTTGRLPGGEGLFLAHIANFKGDVRNCLAKNEARLNGGGLAMAARAMPKDAIRAHLGINKNLLR